MCGIAGTAASSAELVAGCVAENACDVLAHRGPDAHGEFSDGQVAFRHWRLSILDLSPAGAQPMATEDGRFIICYNGEVYNYRELATELALEGLRSHSDTEVVLRAFQTIGVESFRRLHGIFAFAIFDRKARKLWLVRDRLGIKPLYYRLDDSRLAFASEIKAITSRDDADRCDVSSIHEWLYYGAPLGGRTLYEGIRQLLPGWYLELDLETFTGETKQYWSLERQARPADRVRSSEAEMIATTRRLLEEAVRRQLVSDVPVGIFLSGGIDSTAITAFASRHYEGKLATYSAGFDDRAGTDERPKARRVAERYGTDHHEIEIGGGNVAELVEKMVRHHDMPFSDAANIPLFLMASQISSRTKVVLQGDGGDELFGGYRRYATLRYYRMLHLMASAGGAISALVPGPGLRQRVRRYVNAFAAPDIGSTMALLLTMEGTDTHPASAFTPALRAMIERSDPFARYREVQRSFAEHDIGNQMSLVDLMVELPDIFLEKVDRATMAASLEVRVPFLDEDLVDYVVRIPGSAKMPWGKKKWLLKQALAGVVPNDVLYGPKTGFSVPFGYWLRTSLKPLFFDHLATFQRERPRVLDAAAIQGWYSEYEAGRYNHADRLWKILNFMIWCNNSNITIRA